MSSRKILLIDGSSLAFRAFYSILDIDRFTNRQGLHTNAIYSFKRMLDNVLAEFEPSHVLVAFDKSPNTIRKEKFDQYKGGRSKTPAEFTEQMPYFAPLLEGYGIRHYAMDYYEADDIIGTLSRLADPKDQVVVLSGDKDLTQLASDQVTVYITRKGVSDLVVYSPATIQEKWGIRPEQIIDMKGLMGDSSDNYPGITRVGEKTALKLLHQFGSMEGLYQSLDQLKASKLKENIIKDKDQAFLSKDLARILLDVPLEIDLADIERGEMDTQALNDLYRQLDFQSFLQELDAKSVLDDPSASLADFDLLVLEEQADFDGLAWPDRGIYHTEQLDENYHFAKVEAVCWADPQTKKAYVTSADLAFTNPAFKAWLEDSSKLKDCLDFKKEAVIAARYGLDLAGMGEDVSIMAYLVDTLQTHELADLCQAFGLGQVIPYDVEVYGKGVKKGVPEDEAVFQGHLVLKLQCLHALMEPLLAKLEELDMVGLYREMEQPLARCLAKMEITGIKVNQEVLEAKNQEVLARLAQMEKSIYDLAGHSFNVNSPKQLGQVLFEELKLPVIKKTKTGYSTAADVLDKLVQVHPIIQAILDYRQIAKLQSTYLAGLQPFIKEDGKIHTRYTQTLTQTGRLSSTDPNLQNIPIRIEEGRLVRAAFVPSQPGWQMLGADYSQIELRVLAHISGDEHMKRAFQNGEDIHSATARRVFQLDEDQEVDAGHRRQAKAVNFGIVYGISDYGLSQNLNISRQAAKTFIDRYFKEFPKIRQYMDEIVEQAKSDGYVSTLFHRRRYLPDIHAKNFNLRSFAERTAMNSPIQGTAADIIKLAMVRLQTRLEEEGLSSRLLLQIHDELILEGPKEEMPQLQKLVVEVMESAADLSVPLKVDDHIGDNWYDLK
ncbi:DNA polymerase I [Facklamia hominis]|uniref:DNA polymerase I n=1 Tax=Facklamia hominis TaxID=178214 RepID=A0AAJ1V3C9_9LACT|nr:DNA polymerase I [Facklamia hominis]MDK7187296.1 DNA polymerase I [Facklamia hominis]